MKMSQDTNFYKAIKNSDLLFIDEDTSEIKKPRDYSKEHKRRMEKKSRLESIYEP